MSGNYPAGVTDADFNEDPDGYEREYRARQAVRRGQKTRIAEEQARLVESEGDICPDCGNTPATGACFSCKMD